MRLDHAVQLIEINKALANAYGKHTAVNMALFKVVYAADVIEKRQGKFREYLEGTDIFIRESEGIRDVKKYNYLESEDCFVLEMLVPNTRKDVLSDTNYVYEPLYVYKEGILPPLRAYVFTINMRNLILDGAGSAPKTEKEARELDAERMRQAKIKERERLDVMFDYTDISMRLKHGAAVTDFHSKIDKAISDKKVTL